MLISATQQSDTYTAASWKKTSEKLESILKSRDTTLLTMVCIVKAIVFQLVMYRCDSWTIKKTEELMLPNCGAGEGPGKTYGQQGDQTSQS